jgi:hypothetical protein
VRFPIIFRIIPTAMWTKPKAVDPHIAEVIKLQMPGKNTCRAFVFFILFGIRFS